MISWVSKNNESTDIAPNNIVTDWFNLSKQSYVVSDAWVVALVATPSTTNTFVDKIIISIKTISFQLSIIALVKFITHKIGKHESILIMPILITAKTTIKRLEKLH